MLTKGDGTESEAYDDYVQNERVIKWLRENGLSIVVGIIIGLVGIFGWQQWRSHQARTQAEASQLYQQMQVAQASNQPEVATKLADELMKDYSKSPYAVFAANDRARQQVHAGELDKAAVSLDWAAAHVADTALKPLIQLRVARLQLARDKGAAALATLDSIPATSFAGMTQELRGDVLVKLGRLDDARKAYQAAMSALSSEAPQRGVLQMKLDDLAVAGKQGA
jgi:predicted negative regulator of RcsB-dependent stress response